MTDIRDERIVKFTPNEVSELVDFLRTFEASPKALELHQKFVLRSINAVADVEDVDDEPYDRTSETGRAVLAEVVSVEEPSA